MGALRVLARHLRVFSHTWQHSVMFNVIEPLLYLAAFGFGLGAFVQEIEGMSYLEFLAPGMITLSAMYAATFECTYGTFVRLHYQKTFLALLAGPVTARDVILGEMLYGTLKSALFGTVILGVVTVLGQIRSPQALAIPLLLAVQGMVFAALAMWYTAFVTNIDYLNYYITLAILPFFLFGGLFFPVDVLPVWVQTANYLNPLYHSVEVCRALAFGQASAGLGVHIGLLALIGVLVLPLPLRLMEKRLIN
jgi:ABC-type polysaccharide/polyol phosphate export systems, permease component